jgi:segregation and condensation protein A
MGQRKMLLVRQDWRYFRALADIIPFVSLQVAGHQTERYRVDTTVYEGPLDLLLELIERAELDITTLAIAQVTDQYLAYLRSLREHDAAEVSAFLVMAARLVQIKSAALLPRPALIEHAANEEDDAEALARQLLQYRRFKQISEWLGGRETSNQRTYLRLAPPSIKVEARLDLSEVSLADLINAARHVFSSQPDLPELSRVVSLSRVTIREKINAILDTLKHSTRSSFRALLKTRSRAEIVVTFLALLELIKRQIVDARQDSLFSDIQFDKVGELENQEVTELDFKE